MITNKIYAVIMLALLVLTGCNNDVFLDEPDLPEEPVFEIDGDGGEASFTIPVKGLERLSFDLMSESERFCTYYDKDGEAIDRKSPASEVARILFENDFTKLELTKQDNKLNIRSICNTSQQKSYWTVRLEYSYGVRFVYIHILPGKPIRLIDVQYHGEMEITDFVKVNADKTGLKNNGSIPQIIQVWPYLNEFPVILVEPESSTSWVRGESLTLILPVFNGEKWGLEEKADIRPGVKYSYEGPDRMTRIDIEVPANSYVDIFIDLVYTKAEAKGTMIFYNEVLDRRINVNFTVTSLYPKRYEIRIEDAR